MSLSSVCFGGVERWIRDDDAEEAEVSMAEVGGELEVDWCSPYL